MKTFKQFLAETDDLLNLNHFLDKNCHQFILDAGGEEAIRGFKEAPIKYGTFDGETVRYAVIKTSKNRTPVDMPFRAHEMIDDWFDINFGWKPRSAGAFCFGTGSFKQAKNFGEVYFFYPIGPYEILWSQEYDDLFSSPKTNQLQNRSLSNAELKEVVDEILDFSEYKNRDLSKALKSKHEIMVNCDSYLLIAFDDLKGLLD